MQLTERSAWIEQPPAWPSRWTATVVGGLLAVIYFIDRGSGTAPVQHLYYLPIILAGTRFLTRGGVVVAFMAVVLYHLANPRLLSGAYAEADLVQIALFFAVGVVTARLARDKRRLQELATTDDLTGLRNLRAFEAGLATLVSTAARTGGHVSLLVLDVDNLKALNDRYGHLAGAEGVRLVGHVLRDLLPTSAVACRYGGDEFAVVVPECDAWRALQIAEALCDAVRVTAPVLAGRSFLPATLTISAGVASVAGRELPPDTTVAGEYLFRQADRALYEAKLAGRDQVAQAEHTLT